MYTPSRPCPRRARLAGGQAARLGGDLARLARGDALAQRRGRDAERVQLRDQPLDPRRVGLGVDAVDRRHPLALQELGHLLVGEDHQPLDQAVGLGLRHAARAGHVALGVEAELRLEGLDVEARRPAVLAQRRRGLPRHRQRLGDSLGRPRAAGEDRVELVVVEAGVGADAAAVEARPARLPTRPQLDLGGDGEPLHPGRQAARLAAQRMRQHRLDRARHVGAVGPAAGLEVQRRAGRHVGGDVGDVDPEADAVPLALGGDRVVEVAGGGGVDGEGVQRGEVATSG